MNKFTKPISEIIVHCTATPEDRDLHVADIRRYHIERGFKDIGYHYLVALDGNVEQGRDPNLIGAHCLGHNDRSIGVVYVGGLDRTNKPKDTRTPAQRQALRRLIADLKNRYPRATVHGHCEFAAKACPCFNVKEDL